MVGASKILTVSYGTFSCTLEGFEEPFSTMKAIAEYFRDLAADDRYFGAEPPTPDAEMLHRIAEREIQRRVEAKISEHGVVLRAQDETAAVAAPAPAAPAPIAVVEPAAPVMPEAQAPQVAAEQPVETAPPAAEQQPEPADADAEPESVAAKLMRIRAAVAANQAAAGATMPEFEDEEPATDFSASASDDFGFDLDIGDDFATREHTAADMVPGADAPVAAPAEDAFAEDESFETEAAEDAYAETEEAEAETEEFATADIAEDDADDLVAEAATAEEIMVEAAEEAVAENFDGDEPDDDLPAAPTEAALDLSAWRTEDPVAADQPTEEEAPAGDDEPEQGASFFKRARARIIRMRHEDHAVEEKAPEAEDQAEAEAVALPTDLAESPEDDRRSAIFAALNDEDDDDFGDDLIDEVEPQEPQLSVEEEEHAALMAGIGAAIDDGAFDPSEEDELQRQLAAVAREARRDAHEGRAILENASDDEEASVERLMEEARSKLEGDENRRRFSAISHLKAAVAATVADRKLKSRDAPSELGGDTTTDLDRYRDDLSKAVRPRRPDVEPSQATARPTVETRPTPLVLVSEQRIDTGPRAAPRTMLVRPRRISAAPEGEEELSGFGTEPAAEAEPLPISPEEARSFADFAEKLGANGLSDLLEAAAAYTATVEGRPHFSRPQILQKVAHVSEVSDFSREDGLRSFGMLLREGKIQKISRGQFMITDASKFMTEARTATR